MGDLSWNKRVVLAKPETIYGQDSTPVATDVILAKNITIKPVNATQVPRDVVRPYMGNTDKFMAAAHSIVELEVELAGSGTAGNVPAYGSLLRACGFAETISAGVDVTYDPVSSGQESVSIYFHMDGTKHALLGCRGSVKFPVSANAIPTMQFSLMGLWVDPATATVPTPTFTNFHTPQVVDINTTTLSLHGVSVTGYSLELDIANSVLFKSLIGEESVRIQGRSPTGKIKILAPLQSEKDWILGAKNGSVGTLQLVHGVGAGSIVQIDAPKIQLLSANYGNDNGVATLDIGLSPIPVSGDDEIKITVK